MIFCCCGGVRCVVEPGLYVSRSDAVNVRVGCNVMPDVPASSCVLSAKNRAFPGGGCICLLWTSAVAWSCAAIVRALGRCGGFPYSGAEMSEYISGIGGPRWGGFVMAQRLPIWLVVW